MDWTARRLARIADLGTVVCFLGLAMLYWSGWSGMETAGIVIIVGFLTLASSLIGLHIALHAIGIRCPRCTHRLGRYYRVGFLCFRGPENCPHCGLDFDRSAY
jgi:NO-binding membrane sensor protein with MHYT domain